MTTANLTQNPLSAGLKRADESGTRLFSYLVHGLNTELNIRKLSNVWWQPDSSLKYDKRWFWMFSYKSMSRDFITRLNFVSKSAVTLQISHFGAKKPIECEFVPAVLFHKLVYPKKSPPEVRIENNKDVDFYSPLFAEHFRLIDEHIKRGGKLQPRGWSHLEVALKGYLNSKDTGEWIGWYHPEFLGGRKEIDIANLKEKIAIEVQGIHWHKREGILERDTQKKSNILKEGWRLIWAWENVIRDRYGFSSVLDALKQIRAGKDFIEIK